LAADSRPSRRFGSEPPLVPPTGAASFPPFASPAPPGDARGRRECLTFEIRFRADGRLGAGPLRLMKCEPPSQRWLPGSRSFAAMDRTHRGARHDQAESHHRLRLYRNAHHDNHTRSRYTAGGCAAPGCVPGIYWLLALAGRRERAAEARAEVLDKSALRSADYVASFVILRFRIFSAVVRPLPIMIYCTPTFCP
jgi:hypothetical protein